MRYGVEGEKLRCTREGRRERADENRAAILRVSVRSDCEIILTGRGPGAAFPMMPAVLLRCRSTALQQHRIHTRTRSFKTVACPLRIIIWPCGSHICCFPLSDCGARDRAVVAQRSARLVRFTRPLAHRHATAARADVTWSIMYQGRRTLRIHHAHTRFLYDKCNHVTHASVDEIVT